MAADVRLRVVSRQSPRHALRQFALLRSLDEDALTGLAAAAARSIYPRGALIEEPETALYSMFAVASGGVRVYRLSRQGNRVTLATYPAGSAFSFACFDHPDERKSLAETLAEDTLIFRIPPQAMAQLIAAHPQFALDALAQLCQLCAEECDRVEELALQTVEFRLAHVLARLAAADEKHIVSQSHEELAWLIGASRQRVTTALGHLCRCHRCRIGERRRSRGWPHTAPRPSPFTLSMNGARDDSNPARCS